MYLKFFLAQGIEPELVESGERHSPRLFEAMRKRHIEPQVHEMSGNLMELPVHEPGIFYISPRMLFQLNEQCWQFLEKTRLLITLGNDLYMTCDGLFVADHLRDARIAEMLDRILEDAIH